MHTLLGRVLQSMSAEDHTNAAKARIVIRVIKTKATGRVRVWVRKTRVRVGNPSPSLSHLEPCLSETIVTLVR